MGSLDRKISEEFTAWEQRGRGWHVWPEPVRPEPPFQEFTGYRLFSAHREVDDGRRPGFLASLFDSVERQLSPKPPRLVEEVSEPEALPSEYPLTTAFIASLPAQLKVSDDAL